MGEMPGKRTERLVTRDGVELVFDLVGEGPTVLLDRARADQDGASGTWFTAIADALEAEDPATVADPVARGFRVFAERTGADRHALAAIQRAAASVRRAFPRWL